jgi:TonB family protein
VVEIAVDATGQVIATKLDASSGLAEADAQAVTQARTLRFLASSSPQTTWGNAIFQWQTLEPPAAGPPK